MPQEQLNILISGAARGIGRCMARAFLQKGHRVFLLDIDEAELKHTTTVHLKAHSQNLDSEICNLRDLQAIHSAVVNAASFFGGRIDVLINNGGIAAPQWRDGKTMLDPGTLGEWQAYLETNLTAPFAMSQAVIPYMKREQAIAGEDQSPGPCIIHIGSVRAHQSDLDQEGYAASKAALLGLTHSMAVSCQRWGIRVNLVAPGRIRVGHESEEGDREDVQWEDQQETKDVEEHLSNRVGMPEDVVGAVEYMIGAGFVTGQDITVDGGLLKKKN